MYSRFLLFFLCVFCLTESRAAHLIGGDFTFECVGNNRYDFELNVYRDRDNPNGTPHDPEANIYIYDLDDNSLYLSPGTNRDGTRNVTNNDLGPCLQNPDPPSYDLGIFTFDNILLPPNIRGYRVIYQRCCRGTTDNLSANFDGFTQGSTYEIIISPEVMTECDGSATPLPILEFQDVPPTQWCAFEEVTVDQSVNPAIFSLVDSVTYELCAPNEGGSGSSCIIPDPLSTSSCFDFATDCAEPCAFTPVQYNAGYTSNTPMGAGATINFNEQTGSLSVTPDALGLFVVGVCATAWKDGVQYNTITRDFTFKVFDCQSDGAGDPIALNGNSQNSVTIDSIGTIDAVYLVCSSFSAFFDHESSDEAINWYWDFGDPTTDADTSTQEFPFYTYADTGTYLVTFIVNRNAPCVDTAYGVVRIIPEVGVSFTADVGCFTAPVEFNDASFSTLDNNQITSWDWDFGDGNTDSGSSTASYTYGVQGSFTPQLIIQTELGCIDTFSLPITTEPSPTAGIGNLIGCTDAGHVFDNLSNLNATALESYSWDLGLGDGFSFTSTNFQSPTQIYPDSGTYTVQLATSSTNGCSDTAQVELLIVEQTNAQFSYDPLNICPGQEVRFINETEQYFDSLQWVIDGNTFTTGSATFTFSTPGIKPVELTVYSFGECGDTENQALNIEVGPFAEFEVDSTCTGSNFTFLNNSMENGIVIDSFIWDFGDGNTGVGTEPVHTYQNAGDFTVTVITATQIACQDTASLVIPVKQGLETNFEFSPDTICEGFDIVNFNNLTTGGQWDSVIWDLDLDTIFDRGEQISYLYPKDGNYAVTMTVYDDVCGVNDTTIVVPVLDVPEPGLPDTLNLCDGIIKRVTVNNAGNYEVTWSTGQINQDEIGIDNSIDSLTVIVNNLGCATSDLTIITRDCPAYLPNTFSPNGDGVNDRFAPLTNNITSFSLSIYSRWGELVYTGTTFDGWDGTLKGEPAPIDTYVYTFDGIGLDEKVLKQFGSITLIR